MTSMHETFTLDLQKTLWDQQLGLLSFLWTPALNFLSYFSLHAKEMKFKKKIGVDQSTYA